MPGADSPGERTYVSRRRSKLPQPLLHVPFAEMGQPLEERETRYTCNVELVGEEVAQGGPEWRKEVRWKRLVCGSGREASGSEREGSEAKRSVPIDAGCTR